MTGDAPAVAAKVGRDLGILRSRSASLDDRGDLIDQVAALPANRTAFDADLERGLDKKATLDDKDLIITGSQLAALSDDREAFDAAIERCIIFAKVSPFQKRQVVARAGEVEPLPSLVTESMTLWPFARLMLGYRLIQGPRLPKRRLMSFCWRRVSVLLPMVSWKAG